MAISESDFVRKLGQVLREIRVKAGLSQTQVGVALGMKPPNCKSYIWRLETGRVAEPGLRTVMRIAEICRVDASDVIRAITGYQTRGDEQFLMRSASVKMQIDRRDERRRERDRARRMFMSRMKALSIPILQPYLVGKQALWGGKYLNAVTALVKALQSEARRATEADTNRALGTGLPGEGHRAQGTGHSVAADDWEKTAISEGLDPEAVKKIRATIEKEIGAAAE